MAIYHLSMQIISRSKGQSAVASAAYRSGDQLFDERTGKEKLYRREIKPEAMILAPSNAPNWVYDRNKLWNEVERAEKRKDSQLAREMNIALPRELSNKQQEELIRSFVQEQFVDKGMIADIAIHRDDKFNPHAHIMLTMRTVDEKGFGKKNRDWNADFANSKENERGFIKSGEHCFDIRKQWADYANVALDKNGINKKITHLSHEARGLKQLPTEHLGYVASEMEKRGVETIKGNKNRDRQEYNRLVVDLQKYREEKRLLEQQKTRQQEQKQQAEFNTPEELVALKEASKLLKTEPTLANISERKEQLDRWEKRVSNGDQFAHWKDNAVLEAAEYFRLISSFEDQIKKSEQQINNISWLNPLKIKENRSTKERAEQAIFEAKNQIQFYRRKLDYYREKLGFNTEKEFNLVKEQIKIERPGLLEINKKAHQQINFERDMLQKAENALKNTFVRQVASKYPNHPQMAYISLETAMRIQKINKANNKVVSLEQIEKDSNSYKQEIQRLKGKISHVDLNQSRLQRTEGYLKNYEKHQAVIEKYENTPYLKGKMLVSKSTKKEYNKAVSTRDKYLGMMKKEGISGRDDFKKQVDMWTKAEVQIPEFTDRIQSLEKGISLVEAIFRGVEQANKAMLRERKQQNNKEKNKRWKNIHSDLSR